MKIAIFTDTYLPQINGVVTSTKTFKDAFEALGHTVYVMCPKVGASNSTEKVWRFPSVTYPFQKEYRLVLPYSKQLKHFKDLEVDVIHAQTPFTMGYLAQYLGKKYAIPVVHTYHTFFMEYVHYVPVLPTSWMKTWAANESCRFCNRSKSVIVPSSQMEGPLRDYGVTVPIHVIPTGVTAPDISSLDPGFLNEDYGLREDDEFLIYVGRMGVEKNVFFLLEAFSKVHERYPNLKLLMVGGGPELHNLGEKVAELGIEDAVIFTGYFSKEQVFAALKKSLLLLFPSKTETQGLSIVEALSVGTPSICINEMGVKDVLDGQKGGVLCEDSLDAYVKAILNLLEDRNKLEEKSKDALVRAKDFSSELLAKKMLYVFEEAMS